MKNRLTIAVQKKGRLFDQSIDLIKKSGINFSTKGDNLLAKSNNLPIDILFVRSDDIPSLVSNGDADLGDITTSITDAFSVPTADLYDHMEPGGSTVSVDLGAFS